MSKGPVALGLAGIALAAVLGLAVISAAQEGGETGIAVPAALAPKVVKKADEKAKPRPEFPAFAKVMNGFTGPYPGLYSIYADKKKHRLYAVVPSSQMNRPFLLATSFAGGTTYAGWQWNDYLLYWKPMGKQLVLMEKNVRYVPGSSSAEVREVVQRTYTDRVYMTVPILSKGGGGYVIDFGSLLAGNASRFFGRQGRGNSSLAEFSFKAYKFNVEARVTMPGSGGQYVTLHYSIADVTSLSTKGYKPRLADDRVGYFLTAVKDFSQTRDPNRFVRYINRWNLQKRDPKLKMSPPKKPIVFYIEKTVPVRYRRYVREGIEMWNQAFTKCGFINAIEVRQQESFNEFADLEPGDMRYNFFRWITSERAFAMGPSRANPMTGEIIDADIIMDDSMVKSYLREYAELIRDLNDSLMTEDRQAYYRAHPRRNPARVDRPVTGGCGCGQVHAKAAAAASADDPQVAPTARAEFMNRFKNCNIGSGKAHQLSLAGLLFAFADDEDKKKDDEDKKKGDKKDSDKKDSDKKDGDKKDEKKKKQFPEEFIGQLIREIVCHEVGHTLGLRHNFKGSTFRTLVEINSKQKPADTSGSVMDYNPVNVAVDTPQGYWAPSALGPYDFWAIEYGYRPTKNVKDLVKIASRGAEKGLDYGTDEDVGRGDPFVNRWDAGADPIAYAAKRIRYVERLRKDLIERTVEKGEGYQNLRRAFDTLMFEIANAGGLAAQFVGGYRMNRDHRGQAHARDPIQIVPAAKQREGLKFVCENILSDKHFQFPPELLRKLATPHWMHWGTFPSRDIAYPLHDRVLRVQTAVLSYFTYPGTLRRIYDAESMVDEKEDSLTLVELFETVQGAIWSELASKPSTKPTDRKPYISSTRRNLQRFYVEELTGIALDPNDSWMPAAVRTLARHQVKQLSMTIGNYLANNSAAIDTYTRSHLEECQTLLRKTLEAAFQLGGSSGGGFLFF